MVEETIASLARGEMALNRPRSWRREGINRLRVAISSVLN